MIIRYSKPEEYEEICRLRWEILRKPFDLPEGSEKDNKEDTGIFVVAFDDEREKIVGTARLIHENRFGEIGSVAVSTVYQKMGIRSSLVSFLHEKARALDLKTVTLFSKKEDLDFYKKLEYTQEGDFFVKNPTNTEKVRMEWVVKQIRF